MHGFKRCGLTYELYGSRIICFFLQLTMNTLILFAQFLTSIHWLENFSEVSFITSVFFLLHFSVIFHLRIDPSIPGILNLWTTAYIFVYVKKYHIFSLIYLFFWYLIILYFYFTENLLHQSLKTVQRIKEKCDQYFQVKELALIRLSLHFYLSPCL